MGSRIFFATTPIFYANSIPHLGHLYTAVVADALQRFQKLANAKDVILSTGMDEHGLKIQQASVMNGKTPLQHCDIISDQFKQIFDKFSIQYSNFIRTTEEEHKKTVSTVFKSLGKEIYKDRFEGWYCVSDETFVTEKQISEAIGSDGKKIFVSKESGHPVEWTSEINYMFRLSKFQNDLTYWLKSNDIIIPSRFNEELKSWILDGLHDISISRPKSRVFWGIPLPSDPDYTIYVWFDALINYLTVAGYPNMVKWPPDLQVIGKDILRFHGIYWPALLIALGLEPPRKMLVHSHWQVEGKKMSKSIGNVVSPTNLLNIFTNDAVRYILLKSGGFGSDKSWSTEQAIKCVNADLANTLGNLLNRCTAKSLNPQRIVPSMNELVLKNPSSSLLNLIKNLKNLPGDVRNCYEYYDLNGGIELIMNLIRSANILFEAEKPWVFKNIPEQQSHFHSILLLGMIAVRSAAICLQPIVPEYASSLLNSLNVPENDRNWSSLNNPFENCDDFNSVFKYSHLGLRTIPFTRIKL